MKELFARKIFAVIGLSCFSFLLSLFLAEVFLSLFYPAIPVEKDLLGKSSSRQNRESYEMKRGCYKNVCIDYLDLKANQSGKAIMRKKYEYQWAINSLGIRDNSEDYSHFYGNSILVLGDSQTFGAGVEQTGTFAHQLETILEQKVQFRGRVFNAGVRRYSTFHELWKLKEVGPAIRPAVVIVSVLAVDALVNGGNDLWQNFKFLEHRTRRNGNDSVEENVAYQKSFLEKHSHVWAHFMVVLQKLKKTTYEDQISQMIRVQDRDLKRAWEIMKELLEEIRSYSSEHFGAITVVLYNPFHYSVINDETATIEKLKKLGFPVISPLEELRDAVKKDGIRKYLVRADTHWNAKANRIIAEKIASYLIQEGHLGHMNLKTAQSNNLKKTL